MQPGNSLFAGKPLKKMRTFPTYIGPAPFIQE
jgi:hypothetical protein